MSAEDVRGSDGTLTMGPVTAVHKSVESAFHSVRIVQGGTMAPSPAEGWGRLTKVAWPSGGRRSGVSSISSGRMILWVFTGVCGLKISPACNNSHCFSPVLTARLTTAGCPQGFARIT